MVVEDYVPYSLIGNFPKSMTLIKSLSVNNNYLTKSD
jgi:hypothetical protein